MAQPEDYRNKWALGLTISLSILILASFTFYKGYLSFGESGAIAEQKLGNQVANVISADSASSPIQNTKETFSAGIKEISKKYQELKDSVSDVLVPFVTGIEVYER